MSSDRELLTRVRTQLMLEPNLTIDRLQIHVQLGMVTLMGCADSHEAARRAVRAVARIRGARAVINQLTLRAHSADDAVAAVPAAQPPYPTAAASGLPW
jgi:osmotically-inducible protein OsmY